jgi:hypothetical protein
VSKELFQVSGAGDEELVADMLDKKKALGSVQQRKSKGVTAFEEKKRKERNVVGD